MLKILKPILGLKQDFIPNIILSSSTVVTGTILNLFNTRIEYIFVILLLTFIDFITGNLKAMKKDGLFDNSTLRHFLSKLYKYIFTDKIIKSNRWMDTIIKMTEYIVIIYVFVIFSNVLYIPNPDNFIESLFNQINNFEMIVVFFIGFREIKSIMENTKTGWILTKIKDELPLNSEE